MVPARLLVEAKTNCGSSFCIGWLYKKWLVPASSSAPGQFQHRRRATLAGAAWGISGVVAGNGDNEARRDGRNGCHSGVAGMRIRLAGVELKTGQRERVPVVVVD